LGDDGGEAGEDAHEVACGGLGRVGWRERGWRIGHGLIYAAVRRPLQENIFLPQRLRQGALRSQMDKSFLVLFFKKERACLA
jgi:hypothetical protein